MSRHMWIEDRERNTKFYQSYAKRREAKNAISELYDNEGKAINKEEDIAAEALNFYTNLYNSRVDNVDVFAGYKIKKAIDNAQNVALCRLPDEEEIKNAVRGIGVDKSPGPDGFNTMFY